MPHRRTALLAACLLAACAPAPPPPDPATLAANTREQAKLAALADCHLRAQNAGADDPAAIDRCMERRGYWREAPVAQAR